MFRKIIFILLILSAIFCAAYMQPNIKSKPQLYFIGLSAITTVLLFTRVKVIPNILYNFLIGVMFYLMFFVLCMFVIDLIAPDRATAVLEDGRKVMFNDFTFIYAVIIGLVLSIITIAIYARVRKKISLVNYEKYFALTTFVVTFVGYLIHEL